MNAPHDIAALGMAQAAGRIARGEMSCAEYARALLDAIARTRDSNAWIHVDAEGLSKAAAAADREPAARGPLHGVPLAFKDNIDVAGLPTTAGSPALRGHVPRTSSAIAQRLLDAGALALGKTNLHEFALGITNDNAAFGAVRNPHAPDRIAGGSSGGAGAAVAALAAPAAIGTDTGGSVRIPAALCGVAGFRPSTGRWPTGEIVPISTTRDTPGAIARSVADCALLDAVVTGRAARGTADRRNLARQGARVVHEEPLRGLRLGVPTRHFWTPLDDDTAKAANAALERLRDAGAEFVRCEVDDVAALTAATGMTIARYETLPALRDYWSRHGLAFDFDALVARIASPDVRHAFEGLADASAPTLGEYRRATRELRPALQRAWRRCFESNRIAALVFPTTPLPAARIGEEFVRIAGETSPVFPTYIRNTEPGTVTGAPGLTIPCGTTSAALPVGLAIDALPGDDERLLRIGIAIEQALGSELRRG